MSTEKVMEAIRVLSDDPNNIVVSLPFDNHYHCFRYP
jgi:hypothetical protein